MEIDEMLEQAYIDAEEEYSLNLRLFDDTYGEYADDVKEIHR